MSVYGYKSGGYSLVGSQGLTRLQEGFPQQGTVGGGDEKQYFEFFNPPGPAQSIQVWRAPCFTAVLVVAPWLWLIVVVAEVVAEQGTVGAGDEKHYYYESVVNIPGPA